MMNKQKIQINIPLILFLFLLNPFFGCLFVFFLMSRGIYNKAFPLIVSLFIGLLAFTQYAPNCDINRSYHTMWALSQYNLKDLYLYLLIDKYKLYTILNYIIIKITGNPQYTSLFWGTCIYYFVFKSFENLKKYYKHEDNGNYFILYVSSFFCFVEFVEVMETIKQGVGISLFLYSFSLFLLKRYKPCIAIFILSLGVHMSQLFLLPLFLCKIVKSRYLVVLCILSYFIRNINIMSITNLLAEIVGLDVLAQLSRSYVEQNFNNFASDSPFFLLIFFIVLSFVILHCVKLSKSDNAISNIGLIYIIILNLNFSNNHNYTRILLYSYPIFILFFTSFLYINRLKNRFAITYMISACFFIQFWFSYGRFGTNLNYYQTSFMNNSIISIMTSSIHGYLTYYVPFD